MAQQANAAFYESFGDLNSLKVESIELPEIGEGEPAGVDLIFDCASGETLQQSLPALKENGKLVSILNRGENLDPDIDFEYVFVEPHSRQLDHIRELVESNQIEVPVSRTFSLDETAKALEHI